MILFIDIETVPIEPDYSKLSPGLKYHWQRKLNYLRLTEEEQNDEALAYLRHAGIYSEWSKVICIGLGYRKGNKLRLKAYSGDDEQKLLTEFIDVVTDFTNHEKLLFCGHNVKEFDIPFLCRRLVANGIKLPKVMDLAGMKPWENEHIDTMQMWRFGDYKRFTALDLIAHALDIQSPKTDMDGSQVSRVYYEEGNLSKIVDYCIGDVFTTAQIYYKLSQQYDVTLTKELI